MKRFIILMFFISIFSLTASETAGMAGAFLRYGLDARSESLGRAVTADTSSAYAVFFNPAAGAFISEKQILCGMKILSMDRKFAYVSYAHPVSEKASISGGMLYSGTTDIEARDKYGDLFDTYSCNENMFFLNFGLKPKSFLSIGVTAKVIWFRFPEFDAEEETVSSLTFAYDVGIISTVKGLDGLILGLSMRNVKGKNSWDSSKVWTDGSSSVDYYPVTVSFGAEWNPSFNPDLRFYSEINTHNWKHHGYGAGLEWISKFDDGKNSIALRCGTISGFLSLGFGYEFSLFEKKMVVDYSFTHEDISEFDPHTLSWRFYF